MSERLKLSVSPHIHGGRSTSRIMLDVLIALLPATIAGTVIFGLRALLVVAVCVASCMMFEFLFNLIRKKEQTVTDLSAAVTGLILALNLPAEIPLWQCVVGSLFAIVVVKCIFGGIGCNVVNPAIAARVFMLVSFGSMVAVTKPVIVELESGATPLVQIQNGNAPSILDSFLGLTGGTIGETCALALLIGFVYLLVRKVITWHIPVSIIATVFVFSFFAEGFDVLGALSLILSGGLMLGSIFMATDYMTSPTTPWGKLIFGVGIGLITCLIRYFGSYPEGMSFAILFMNILVPYIDKCTRRKIFGEGGARV